MVNTQQTHFRADTHGSRAEAPHSVDRTKGTTTPTGGEDRRTDRLGLAQHREGSLAEDRTEG